MTKQSKQARDERGYSVQSASDDLERMSGEGGVAPLIPHRQPTQGERREARGSKNLRM